jgi:hypothetical protein
MARRMAGGLLGTDFELVDPVVIDTGALIIEGHARIVSGSG